MGFLRRIFGRDVKTDTAVQNGYTLVADDTKTSGLDWSDVLLRGGLGRDLSTGINSIDATSIDTTLTPGEYHYTTNTTGDTPSDDGLVKVWRESSSIVYQLAQSSTNKLFSRRYDGSWGPWTEYMDTTTPLRFQRYMRFTSPGSSGTWTVPAGVQVILVLMESGSTASGEGGVGYAAGDYSVWRAKVINAKVKNTRAFLLQVTEGQQINYTIGTGESVRDPLAATLALDGILTENVATATTIQIVGQPVVRTTGAPVAYALMMQGHSGDVAIEVTYRPLRVDGKMTFTYAAWGAGVQGNGDFYGGDAGRLAIIY